ncbi:MAG: hypothetical protein J6D47_07615 [Peptostreptococcaceae bacterium]|nr:hypothetical protein [Peptostreptococcaceae bacterium]
MFLTIVILFILFIIWMIKVDLPRMEKQQQETKEIYRKQGLEYIGLFSFECIGGFSDIGACKNCYIDLFEEKMTINLYKESSSGSILASKVVVIKMSDILSAELQTETQISEQISLGKLITFGLLSFAMKKNPNEIIREYLVINMKYEDKEISLILKPTKDDQYNLEQQFRFLREVNRCIKLDKNKLVTN